MATEHSDENDAREAFRAACARAKRYTDPTLARVIELTSQGRLETGGWGSYIRTAGDGTLLDACGGYGLFNVGRRNKLIVKKVIDQLRTLAMGSRVLPNRLMGDCAQRIVEAVPGMQHCFLCSEGTMAVDAAIKYAAVATSRAAFARIQGAYHGQSIGALMLCGTGKRRAPFTGVLHHNVIELARNTATEVDKIDTTVAAVFVEVIQGEAGIWPLTTDFLLAIQQRCRATGALLVIDEIQTGFGRTGTMWAFQHHPGLQPDIVTIGKAAGGGILPVAACLYSDEVQAKMKLRAQERTQEWLGPFHASTTSFSLGPCAALLATLELVETRQLAMKAGVAGHAIFKHLATAFEASRIVRDVRGRGLMIGIEFVPHDDVQYAIEFRSELLARGVLTAPTMNDNRTIRIQPALTYKLQELKQLIKALEAALLTVEAKYVH